MTFPLHKTRLETVCDVDVREKLMISGSNRDVCLVWTSPFEANRSILLDKRHKIEGLRDWLNSYLNDKPKEESKVTCEKSKAVSGDVVHVRGTVVGSNPTNVQMKFQTAGNDAYVSWVPRECITKVEERQLRVGDKVTVISSRHVWEIRAIEDERLWIKKAEAGNDAFYTTVNISEATRA